MVSISKSGRHAKIYEVTAGVQEFRRVETFVCCKKVKQSHYRPGQVLRVPEFKALRFQDNRHMKVVRFSALLTGHLYPQNIFLVLISAGVLVDPRAVLRPENSNDTIGNRTRFLPACSAVPQPTAPPSSTVLSILNL
jgi:hypothetical protein